MTGKSAGSLVMLVMLVAGLGGRAAAQSGSGLAGLLHRTDLFAGLSGVFTQTSHTGTLTNSVAASAGAVAGLRVHLNEWNAIEVRYSFTRDTQTYLLKDGYTTSIPTHVHELSFDYVRTLARRGNWAPFVLIGGGLLHFNAAQDPETAASSVAYQNWGTDFDEAQTKGAMVYGGGVDYRLRRNLLLRAEYRGLMYRLPAEGVATGWSHFAEPAVGLVWRF